MNSSGIGNIDVEYLDFKIDSLEKELARYKPRFEAGKVYARCAMPPVFENMESKNKYCFYIGARPNQVGVRDTSFMVTPAHVKWVKKQASDLCTGYNYLDDNTCEAWHLEEVAPQYKQFFIVTDTARVKGFEIKPLVLQKLIRESYLTSPRALTCPTVFYPKRIQKIQDALVEKGFLTMPYEHNVMDKATKTALRNYQRKNNLNVGKIDFKTLQLLGVKMD